jgi:hypothetical protein
MGNFDVVENNSSQIENDFFTKLSQKDTGDETQRRFRYQHTVTAYYSLLMYLEEIPYQEILCEHHEDIVGVLENNHFHGIQVKTRDPSLGLLKLNDDAIKSSIIRFLELDMQFPGCFDRFIIVSNCNYLLDATGNSIKVLKDQLALAGSSEYQFKPNTLDKYIDEIQRKVNCTRKNVLDTLIKTEFQTMSGFDEIESKIIVEIMPKIDICASFPIERLKFILNNLVYDIYSKSSRKSVYPISDYISLLKGNPAENLVQSEINIKRISKKIVKSILSSASTQTYFLASPNEECFFDLNTQKIMISKMNCGMIDPDAIAVMDQLRDSSEQYFLTYFHKNLDRINSKMKFTHIRNLILNQAVEAKIKVKKDNAPYGEDMLREIEKRLLTISEKRADDVDHCPYEILKGLVGSLAGECKVQFSPTPKGGWNSEK